METNQRGESAPMWRRQMETKSVHRREGRNFSSYTEPRGSSCAQPQPRGAQSGTVGLHCTRRGPQFGAASCRAAASICPSMDVMGLLGHRGSSWAWGLCPSPSTSPCLSPPARALCNGRQRGATPSPSHKWEVDFQVRGTKMTGIT